MRGSNRVRARARRHRDFITREVADLIQSRRSGFITRDTMAFRKAFTRSLVTLQPAHGSNVFRPLRRPAFAAWMARMCSIWPIAASSAFRVDRLDTVTSGV